MSLSSVQLYADIILPFSLPRLYTYGVPAGMEGEAVPGKRAIVQFGARKFYTGIIRILHNSKPEGYDVKEIISIPDDQPVVSPVQFSFWDWISEYYVCTSGEVFKAALPSGFKLESESLVILNRNFTETSKIDDKEAILLDMLEKKSYVTVKEVNNLFTGSKSFSIIKSLVDKGAINIEQKIFEAYKPRFEKYMRTGDGFETEEGLKLAFEMIKRSGKQTDLLMNYISISDILNGSEKRISKSHFLKETGASAAILDALVKKGIFVLEDIEISRLENYSEDLVAENVFNDYQQKAYDSICHEFEEKNVVLLHGVTSSGKTEIYIRLIKEYIKLGKQVLYLLPEIALTTQIINRLKKQFGNEIGVYHSKFSDSEKVEIWNNLENVNLTVKENDLKKRFKVILGVRSSIFLPFSNLGLVIIDEEHENSFKQYDPAPRYNARDAAIVLAKLHNAKTLLGSATPSIESYFNATQGKYGHVELNNRYLDIQLPKIVVTDTRDATKKQKMRSHFSEPLLESIKTVLEEGKQIILFQNRRGFAPFLQCSICGWIPRCKNCDVSLTFHKSMGVAICHYCGHSYTSPDACMACGCFSMETRGFGTEKIEDEIAAIFPEARVARMDLDSTRSRKSYEKIIYDFETNKTNILVGTQMVTKGLDFDNVKLVGILNADNLLYYPDFRANERSFQLMTQVSGRAGRKNEQGNVLIQTSAPEHPIIKDVLNNDYLNMFKTQIVDRKSFNYPPFFRLINITIKHKEVEMVSDAAGRLAKELRRYFGKNVLGPEFPLVKRISNLNLKNILLKIDTTKSQTNAKKILVNEINKLKLFDKFRNIIVVVDVDPM